MKSTVLLFLSLCLLFSCKDRSKDSLETITIHPGDSSAIKIEDLSDSSFYVPLQSKEGYKITTMDQLFVTGEHIVAVEFSKNTVYIFDRNGVPQNKITNTGTEQGRFLHIESIILPEEGKEIEIYDKGRSRILKYDFSGKFLREKRINQNKTLGFNLYKAKDIYVSQLLYNNYDKRWIGIFTDNKPFINFVASTLRIPPIARKLDILYTHQLDTYKDSLYYYPLMDNQIYNITINGAKPAYRIASAGNNFIDDEFADQKPFGGYKLFNSKMASTNFIFNNDCLFVGENFVFFRYNFKSQFKTRNVLYSRKSHKVKQFTEYNSTANPNLALLSYVRAKYKDMLVMDVHPTQYQNLPSDVQKKISGQNPVLLFLKLKDF